jgi:hypothetical protein
VDAALRSVSGDSSRGREVTTANTALDRSPDVAQAALLARNAPGTRIRRVRWSQGETQVGACAASAAKRASIRVSRGRRAERWGGSFSPARIIHRRSARHLAWFPIFSGRYVGRSIDSESPETRACVADARVLLSRARRPLGTPRDQRRVLRRIDRAVEDPRLVRGVRDTSRSPMNRPSSMHRWWSWFDPWWS